jgi:hypothetical protein
MIYVERSYVSNAWHSLSHNSNAPPTFPSSCMRRLLLPFLRPKLLTLTCPFFFFSSFADRRCVVLWLTGAALQASVPFRSFNIITIWISTIRWIFSDSAGSEDYFDTIRHYQFLPGIFNSSKGLRRALGSSGDTGGRLWRSLQTLVCQENSDSGFKLVAVTS